MKKGPPAIFIPLKLLYEQLKELVSKVVGYHSGEYKSAQGRRKDEAP